jgi:hypothetical protein
MWPQGPEMDDILVATVARPQDVDSDERLGERQQQMPLPNQRGRGGRRRGHQSGWRSPSLLQFADGEGPFSQARPRFRLLPFCGRVHFWFIHGPIIVTWGSKARFR